MSRHIARRVLQHCDNRPVLIRQSPATMTQTGTEEIGSLALGFLADIRELARADSSVAEKLSDERRQELQAAYGASVGDAGRKSFVFANGKAIIPIHGTLINRFSYSWGFVTGYNFLRSQVSAALADPDVDGIIYDVDSNGGMVAGCKETSDIIYAASKQGGGKPSIAVIDSACYSAAYYCASGADQIVCTPTGGAGSIGVMMMHTDVSGAMEKWGIKVTMLYAGAHKVDGNPYEPLSDEVRDDLNAELQQLYDQFVATVVRNRSSLTDQQVRDTEARAYFVATEALKVGLIDSIAVAPDALDAFFSVEDDEDEEEIEVPDDNSIPEEDDITMTTNTNPAPAAAVDNTAALAQAATDARLAERARISGILNHAEAEGRGELAQHLASTDVSVEVAAGILKASPKVAKVTTPAPAAAGSPFQRAMNTGDNPNVGEGGGGGDPKAEKTHASRAAEILDSQRKMYGASPKEQPLFPQQVVELQRARG